MIRKPNLYNEAAASYGIGAEADHNGTTEENIQAFVAERLARYKHLDGGVQFVKDIPRNASGKVLRPKLRAMGSAVEPTPEAVESKIKGSLNEISKEGLNGFIDGKVNGFLERPISIDKNILTGKFNGTIAATVRVSVDEIREGQDQTIEGPTGSSMVEHLVTLESSTLDSVTSSYAEKIFGDAIENMKKNIKETKDSGTNNSSSRTTMGVRGEKRKSGGMLTRRAKSQSLDMTAR